MCLIAGARRRFDGRFVAFNEEIVARAILSAKIPVISFRGWARNGFYDCGLCSGCAVIDAVAAAEIVVQTRREFDDHVMRLRRALGEQLLLPDFGLEPASARAWRAAWVSPAAGFCCGSSGSARMN